jgi:SAM-dependent methyltransferase
MVEQLLQINQQLCKRLKKLGDPFDARSSIMAHSSRCSAISNSISAPSAPARTTHNNRESIVETMIRFAFEDELNASRVYRMVKDNDCDRSLLSSAMHTQTWSIFSGLSLADISILSVVALPLFPEDIPRQAQYYAFGTTVPPSVATNVQDAESTITPRQPLPSGRPASAERDLSLFPAKDVSFALNALSGGDLVKEDETQPNEVVSMANLRFASLMTSKWLSFGRVLFSPAHFKLENDLNKDRILVLDWLGRDWSYYCALTYPEATVFNLGLGAPSTPVDGPWSTLRNHLQFRHVSIIHPLPFPKDFFACVVLRFPTALRSTTHNFVLSEMKRVLRPDGYLEFNVLDLDLVNMGNRARRAVRGLKIQIQAANDDTSLCNVSDEIIGGLGRKGFSDCQTCIVGVPVAGKLYNAGSSSTEEIGKNISSSSEMSSKGTNTESSFSDLLNMSPSNGSTTNSVPNMIAHVGRWWYSCCFETLVQPTTDDPAANSSHLLKNSIWKDEKLIKECEERGTTFKMLIGYAKKPNVGERRRVSV